MSAEESVVRAALPPATDYLTYLTILEYNLDKDELPVLHEVLQDEKLVTNIGWDLVHLLVPFHPDSMQCLEDIAIRGNPREVIIKVTEELEKIKDETMVLIQAIAEEDHETPEDNEDETESAAGLKDRVNQSIGTFETLLRMLCILHPRIKTRKPSRFLETSLDAILPAYSVFAASPVATRGVLMFLRTLSGSSRPLLPPRHGEPPIPTVTAHEAVPDPEADQDDADDGEDVAQRQMLQKAAAAVMELHLLCLEGGPQSPLAWTDRFILKEHSEWILSERKALLEAFEESEELSSRELLVNQILNVAMTDLCMDWSTLLSIVRTPLEQIAPRTEEPVLISGVACLIAVYLSRRTPATALKDEQITFTDHDQLSTAVLGDPTTAIRSWIPGLIIDAILRVGWAAAPNFNFSGEIDVDKTFEHYLSKMYVWAESSTQDSVSYNAYLFSTHVLQSHPSSRARFSFICGLLPVSKGCTAKALAVGWLRDEYVKLAKSGFGDVNTSKNVFAEPDTLQQVAAIVFIADELRPFAGFEFDMEFFHAGLNLLYFICMSPALREPLEVGRVIREAEVETKYLEPLEETIRQEDEVLERDRPQQDRSYLRLLEFNVSRAREALRQLLE